MPPGKLNKDKAAKREAELERGNSRYWKPKAGKNTIRVMPPWREDVDEIGFEVGLHYGIGPDESFFPCPRLSRHKKKCFLCTMEQKLKDSSDDDDKAEAKQLRPTRRFLLNIVDMNDLESGVQVWQAGVRVYKDILSYISDSDFGDITDLEEGYDLTVIKKGEKMKTEYKVRAAKKPTPFPSPSVLETAPDAEEWLDKLPELDKLLEFASDAEMQAAYEGLDTGTSSEDDEDDRPRRKSQRVEEDDDDDEDEKPKGKAKGKATKAAEKAPAKKGKKADPVVPDDDDDDEDDEDEDEDDEYDEDEDEDSDDDDDEDDEDSDDEDEDEDDEDDDEDEDEDDKKPAPKTRKAASSSKASKASKAAEKAPAKGKGSKSSDKSEKSSSAKSSGGRASTRLNKALKT